MVRKAQPDDLVSEPEAQRKLASATMNVGLLLAANGELERAEERQARAQMLRAELAASPEVQQAVVRDQGIGEYNLGLLALRQDRADEADRADGHPR